MDVARTDADADDAGGYLRPNHAGRGRGGRGAARAAEDCAAMRNVPALLRRELNAYFASVLGYVVIMFFLLGMGGSCVSIVVELVSRGSTQLTVMEGFFSWIWLSSLFLVPAITVR